MKTPIILLAIIITAEPIEEMAAIESSRTPFIGTQEPGSIRHTIETLKKTFELPREPEPYLSNASPGFEDQREEKKVEHKNTNWFPLRGKKILESSVRYNWG